MKNTTFCSRSLLLLAACAAVALTPIAALGGAKKIYWVDAGANVIGRANVDGSGIEDVVTGGLDKPCDLDVDPLAETLYWVEYGSGKLRRRPIIGGRVEDLFTGTDRAQGVALDLAAGKVYWAENRPMSDNDWIRRANLDGSGIEELVTSGFEDGPNSMAVYHDGGRIYWGEGGLDQIKHAALDGADVGTLFTFGYYSDGVPSGVAVDSQGAKLYWVFRDKVQRGNLDGTGMETLISGLVNPRGIALDVQAGKLYFADATTGSIERANLDGSNLQTIISGLDTPRGIAFVVPEPSTAMLALVGLATLAVTGYRRRR